MSHELERIWKEVVMAWLSKILSGIFSWDLENLQSTSVRIAGVSAEIQTKHLPDTSAEYYYTNQLGNGYTNEIECSANSS
jgi:hypothetical protein